MNEQTEAIYGKFEEEMKEGESPYYRCTCKYERSKYGRSAYTLCDVGFGTLRQTLFSLYTAAPLVPCAVADYLAWYLAGGSLQPFALM
ncbi:MAG: hypothetical protein RR653_13580, partial [Clostridia bacterium]